MAAKQPNILFFGIDSLRRDHMSLYGYPKYTTPHIERFLSQDSAIFEHMFSPSIPTTPGYASMLTGLDCFGTDVVALRHQGKVAEGCVPLQQVLKENGYNTTAISYDQIPFERKLDVNVTWGGWEQGRSHKAESMNDVAIPELERLAAEDKPFFLFLRHMDPHSPYLAPGPFERMFYSGNEFDPNNRSLDPVYNFKPFCDYFRTWFPPGCTDADYITAQYDSAIAYMDASISIILNKLEYLGIAEDTIVVFTSDHGETLYDHDCYYDHHSMYDNVLVVPFAVKYPHKLKGLSKRYGDICQLKDVMPTLLELAGIKTDLHFNGRNLFDVVTGKAPQEPEMYITEATWMRKHGWRTPEWKLMLALEPDFHYKPPVELYNLVMDPGENHNVADEYPEIVQYYTDKINKHIAKRTAETGKEAPIYSNATKWNGFGRAFVSSDDAYNSMHIGDPETARRLQELGEKRKS